MSNSPARRSPARASSLTLSRRTLSGREEQIATPRDPARPSRERVSGRRPPLPQRSVRGTLWPIPASNRPSPGAFSSGLSSLLPFPDGPIVRLETPLAALDHVPRGLLGLLLEDITDHDRVHVDPVDDPPLVLLISDSQLMAAFPDGRHRPRIRQGQRLALLDSSQQNARFDPRLLRERWCLDLAVKPCERLIQPLGHPRFMLCQT